MDSKEISNFCIERGILVDNEVLTLFKQTGDLESVKMLLEKIIEHTQQKVITKRVFSENKKEVASVFSNLPAEKKGAFQELKIKLGLTIEIEKTIKEKPKEQPETDVKNEGVGNVKILSQSLHSNKKLSVTDFVNHFKNRYSDVRDILKNNPKLSNPISINKISRNNQKISIVGIVYNKRVTKNGNIVLEVEDLTGKITVLINQNKEDVYKDAEDISFDSIIGINGFGNREIFFANEIVFPELLNQERKKSPVEEHVLFISDVHVGSKRFMEKNFLKFVDYLNGNIPNTPDFDKVKYLFVVGDLIAGVGVYPGQEKDLAIKDIEGQYARAAELFGKIRSDITIVFLPGNHDCVRLMEPQPMLDEKFAWPLYNLKNAVFAPNPSMINIGSRKDFPGFNILAYHGFSYFYYANTIPSLIKEDSINSPNMIMAYLLKNRHIAPTHASVQYFPSEKDNLLIKEMPDIFVSGHLHKNAVSSYNNIITISNSCWETLMPYQEKYGCVSPDYCKVPSFNLKTRQLKILDFDDEEK